MKRFASSVFHSSHYPEVGGTYFARSLSAAYNGGALWIAVQVDQERANKLAVLCLREGERSAATLDCFGFCHQPYLTPMGEDGVVVVWNEVDDEGWKLKSTSLVGEADRFQEVETVCAGERLYLPPSAVRHQDELWVAWPGIEDANIQINVAKKGEDGWQILDPVSTAGRDAFRPSLAANGDELFLAWDQYNGQEYEIVLARWAGAEWEPVTLSRDGERWLRPRVVVSEGGVAYVTWLVLREVEDDLGIIDHLAFAPVVRFADGRLEYLLAADHATDARIVADLREGLLASENYMGYAGLRRNPYLVLTASGELACLWEVKVESEKTKYSGHLVGRRLQEDDTWTPPLTLHSGCIDYAVSSSPANEGIPIAFILYPERGFDAIGGELVRLEEGVPYAIEGSRWQRWKDAEIEPEPKPAEKVRIGEREYSLFWADTHCHSVFSPDAEGEVDEIIHFGRDIAGLDAICVVDNDCYPHKALTEAEWRIHQEFSVHLTREGEYIVFPGWEYTYHRPHDDPNFNHRWIMYPRAGGRLYRRIDPDADEDEKIFRELEGKEVICVPHHCVYKIMDPEIDRNVEVCSSWRICIEETDHIVRLLQSGERFGFVGCSDSHRALPGLGGALTGLFAEDLTPEGLYDAYRRRRTIATQGFPIFIDFRVSGTFIGGEGEALGSPDVDAVVKAPREIEFVQVLRDGRPVHVVIPRARDCGFRFEDHEAGEGEHFYTLRVKLIGDPSFNCDPEENVLHRPFTQEGRYPGNLARARGVFAWTSPVWLRIASGA